MSLKTAAIDALAAKEYVQGFVWTGITNTDTVKPVRWRGGDAAIEVIGELNGASVVLTRAADEADTQYPLDIDNGTIDATTARNVIAKLGIGYVGATISGGGSSQNLKIVIREIRAKSMVIQEPTKHPLKQ